MIKNNDTFLCNFNNYFVLEANGRFVYFLGNVKSKFNIQGLTPLFLDPIISSRPANALLRQYFPKGTDFSKVSKERLKIVQDELNDRPRKVLGFYTPHEKFAELLR